MRIKLALGCTLATHQRLGIHAVVNARGGLQSLNSQSLEEIEIVRDARAIRDCQLNRTRFYQFGSRCFRRRMREVGHLLADRGEL